jgi:hypothetical protein
VSVDLALATIDDMVSELERRGLRTAMVVSHGTGRHDLPGADAPPPDRGRVYGASQLNGPAEMAAFLCNGIQWCLSEILRDARGRKIGPFGLELSTQMKVFQHHLKHLGPQK